MGSCAFGLNYDFVTAGMMEEDFPNTTTETTTNFPFFAGAAGCVGGVLGSWAGHPALGIVVGAYVGAMAQTAWKAVEAMDITKHPPKLPY